MTFEPVPPTAPTPGAGPAAAAAAPGGRTALSLGAGLLAALAGAAAWAVLVEVSGYKIGFAAVGIGWLVGQAMAMTASRSRALPPAGAVLAFAGCLLGDALADANEVSKAVGVDLLTVLRRMATDPGLTADIFRTGFSAMDLLFWAIAAFEGFRLTARAVARRNAGPAPVPADGSPLVGGGAADPRFGTAPVTAPVQDRPQPASPEQPGQGPATAGPPAAG